MFRCKESREYPANIERKYFGGEPSERRNGERRFGKVRKNTKKHVSRYMFYRMTYILLKNSLKIHEENTKEMTTLYERFLCDEVQEL